jgi:hypothetical protein
MAKHPKTGKDTKNGKNLAPNWHQTAPDFAAFRGVWHQNSRLLGLPGGIFFLRLPGPPCARRRGARPVSYRSAAAKARHGASCDVGEAVLRGPCSRRAFIPAECRRVCLILRRGGRRRGGVLASAPLLPGLPVEAVRRRHACGSDGFADAEVRCSGWLACMSRCVAPVGWPACRGGGLRVSPVRCSAVLRLSLRVRLACGNGARFARQPSAV